MNKTHHQDEQFVLRRQNAGGFITVPANPEHFPMLLRLHGNDPKAVGAVLDDTEDQLIASVLEIAPAEGVEATIVGKTEDGDTRFLLRDLQRLEHEGAVDLSDALSGAGYKLPAKLLADGRVVLPWTERGAEMLRIDLKADQAPSDARVAAVLSAVRKTYPEGAMCSLRDLLEQEGCETPFDLGRSLYKSTACGPWVSFIVPGYGERGQVYYETKDARQLDAPWWDQCIGILVGSIVEGSDVEVDPTRLEWPFTSAKLEEAVRLIDEEANFYWRRDNAVYFKVEDKTGAWAVIASWVSGDELPSVDDIDGELDHDQALAVAKQAGSWVIEHPAPDYETWREVENTGLRVLDLPAPSSPF